MLTFRRTHKGKEKEVAEALVNKLMDESSIPDPTFITFGQYDLVTLKEYTDLRKFRKATLSNRPFHEVYNTNSHACFSWAPQSINGVNEVLTPPLSELINPLMGVCFLKIDPNHLHTLGIHAESSLVETLVEQARTFREKLKLQTADFQLAFLGCFGWCEIILLISARSAQVIHQFSSLVRDLV